MFDLNEFFNHSMCDFGDGLNHLTPCKMVRSPQGFWPVADIIEDMEGTTICLDMPGVKPEDLKISFENNVLVVAGERKHDERKMVVAERCWGKFKRAFGVPRDIDRNHIEAKYDAGVLKIRLPRSAETKPRNIEIKIG